MATNHSTPPSWRGRPPEKYREQIEKTHKRRAHRKATGLCRCGLSPAKGHRSCETCLRQARLDSAKRQVRRREKGLCSLCGRPAAGKPRCPKCREVAVRYEQRLKREVIARYGGKCECCGESEMAFLTIDHVFNNGAQHRKEMGSARVYNYLKRNGYPREGYRVLCFNCNCGRRINGGKCPHET